MLTIMLFLSFILTLFFFQKDNLHLGPLYVAF
uniref:Uncharacterized protein n=1 Tax=Arundo donax TaxID=35708 RepID=A0A0A8YQF5_ARUDO